MFRLPSKINNSSFILNLKFREKHEARLYGKMELNIADSPNSKFYSNVLNLGYDPIHLKAAVAVKNRKNLLRKLIFKN